jgi:CspA family cold shock protein
MKVRVQLVKYDMTKTKNRNRKNMLVDGQNDEAVRLQLEKIHKGEKVVTIHEIIWDEKQIQETVRMEKIEQRQLFYGVVKFFDLEKGFGFIAPDEDIDDIFFHKTSVSGKIPHQDDKVVFKISEAPKGLCAIQVKIIEN